MNTFFNKNRHTMIFQNEEQMENRAEALTREGFLVEREMLIQPLPTMCLTTYKLTYRKEKKAKKTA